MKESPSQDLCAVIQMVHSETQGYERGKNARVKVSSHDGAVLCYLCNMCALKASLDTTSLYKELH